MHRQHTGTGKGDRPCPSFVIPGDRPIAIKGAAYHRQIRLVGVVNRPAPSISGVVGERNILNRSATSMGHINGSTPFLGIAIRHRHIFKSQASRKILVRINVKHAGDIAAAEGQPRCITAINGDEFAGANLQLLREANGLPGKGVVEGNSVAALGIGDRLSQRSGTAINGCSDDKSRHI